MTDSPLKGATVLVTGGHGFLGKAVLRELARVGAHAVAPTHAELEFRDPMAVNRGFSAVCPDVVIHLAARVGGIGANQLHPGTFWRDNLLMGVNVLEAARVSGVKRVVIVGTVCAYPKFTPVPFREAALWEGYPEETNAPYGVAKRALWTGLDAYHREFGLAGAYILPANMYGPDDDFDLETSHVIPAMIRKFDDAVRNGMSEVVLWGTGAPTREFLYVDDCAEALVIAAATIDDPEPMNVGTGQEIGMDALALRIAEATGFTGRVRWDASRPDGQPRRALDTSHARERLGWSAKTDLATGLTQTVAWFRAAGTSARGVGIPSALGAVR